MIRVYPSPSRSHCLRLFTIQFRLTKAPSGKFTYLCEANLDCIASVFGRSTRDRNLRSRRQVDAEAGATAGLAIHLNRAAVTLNDCERDGKPQPSSASDRFGRIERIEDLGLGFAAHPHAFVYHVNSHVRAGLNPVLRRERSILEHQVFRAHQNLTRWLTGGRLILGGGIPRVYTKVDEYLAQQALVPNNLPGAGRAFE